MSVISTVYPHRYGYIDYPAFPKVAYDQTGIDDARQLVSGVGVTGDPPQKRAYYSFDTSTIPTAAIIEDIDFKAFLKYITMIFECDNVVYGVRVYWEWDRIGAVIDTSDWGFANAGPNKAWGATPPPIETSYTWSFLDVTDVINKTGDTDIELRSSSAWTDCTEGPIFEFETKKKKLVSLRTSLVVVYRYPLHGVTNRICSAVKVGLGPVGLFLMAAGILPPRSRVVGIDGDGLKVRTTFLPRAVKTCQNS